MSEIKVGDFVCKPDAPNVRCQVKDIKGDWARFDYVRKDGKRDRRYYAGFSGSIEGWIKEETP